MTGWVVERQTLDAQNQLVLRVSAAQHRRDPLSGLVMPKLVRIECPRTQFEMKIDLGNVEINTLSGDRPELWAMPNCQGSAQIDLANPQVRIGQSGLSERFSK